MSRRALPRVVDYEDSRAFLKAYYAARKRADRRYSYGVFARRAGVARSHLKMVTDGKRDLSAAMVERYATALGLRREERERFRLLVARAQASTASEREGAEGALRRWQWERVRRVDASRAMRDLLARWPRYLVLGMTRLRDFRADPRWISRRAWSRITPAEAREALGFLRREGLVAFRKGRVVRTRAGEITAGPGMLGRIHRLNARARAEINALVAKGVDGASRGTPAVLTFAEAMALYRSYNRWLSSSLPARRRPPAAGDLMLIQWNAFPLTGYASALPILKREKTFSGP